MILNIRNLRNLAGIGLMGWTTLWGQSPVQSTAMAPAWTSLFDRTQGWTGGDGIFAIPLSGYEGPDRAADNKTLFVFSDSFIGSVDATGKRVNAVMVNNTLAVLDGGVPDSSRIRFIWGKNSQGGSAAAFVPNTPSTAGKKAWYWLQDGFMHKGHVYILPLIVAPNPSGPPGFTFSEIGISLIKIPLGANGEPDLTRHTQKDTPLYFTGGGRTLYYGCGIMPNTVEAGAPDPDGYIYVYGRNSLYVARVLPDEFEDFSKWRYWDGAAWSSDIGKSASLGAGGPELSVSPVTTGPLKGKYLLVTCGIGQDVWIRVGESPWGPFGNRINVFRMTEGNPQLPIYTYNAKAHPSLSSNGDWLVTYNVNTSNWDANLARADIYRPRFFYMRLEPGPIIGVSTMAGRSRRMQAGKGNPFPRNGMPIFQAGKGISGAEVRASRLDGRSFWVRTNQPTN